MAKWSHQRTLKTGLVVIGLLSILSSTASLIAATVVARKMTALALGEVGDLSDGRAAQLLGLREVAATSAALLTGEEQAVRAARSASAELRDQLARLEVKAKDRAGRVLVAHVLAVERDYQDAFEEALGGPGGRPAVAVGAAVGGRGRNLRQSLDSLVAYMQPVAAGGLVTTRAAVGRIWTLFNIVTAITIVLVVILCVMLIGVINVTRREEIGARILAEEGQTRTMVALHAAKASSQLKDEFLATVSHELRNPLAPILTWTQLLRTGTLDREKADRGLAVIERNVISLSELIDDLVDVSRVVSGKFRLDVRPVDLLPLIRTSVEAQRPASDAKQIRLQLILDERVGRVSGDSERLQQVMANLLSNAIKFTPKGGTVQVTLARAESHVEVAVADSGIGIAAAFLSHVFEPFQQATDGTMRRHGGLGLGLSIVRHIVELHGGEIIVESRGTGQGSRFLVKLPLLGTREPDGAPGPRHPSAPDGIGGLLIRRLDGIRVLLVDDEPTANEALEALLHSCGAEVRVAGSTEQALQTLDIWKPDVLVSDIAMPEEDGYVLIRKIRARPKVQGGDLPAAALTAYAKIEDRVRILAAGFQMYLSKPADPNELIAVVASLATRRERDGADRTRPG